MLDTIAGGNWPIALLNIVLLMLWSVLPMLLLAYARQSLVMRRIRPEFTLRKSEAVELDRALVIYQGVNRRLTEIEAQSRTAKGFFSLVLALQPDIEQVADEEREDLKAHARHLRATIAKLRGLPLRRLRARIDALSFHFAVGGAIAIYVGTLMVLVLMLCMPSVRAAARDLAGSGHGALVWYPFDASYFLANGAGAALGMLCAPAFYLVRRLGLAREYAMEFAVLKELAGTPAEEIVHGPVGRNDDPENSMEGFAEEPILLELETVASCFAILGVEQSASVEQIRAAYKMRIKQTHPDRLHDVSPAIRTFAEDETKRLNAALHEALDRLA
jgi:hypothetical protein